MVIASGSEPTPAEAERFMDEWPACLERRLGWFVDESGTDLTLDGSIGSLDPAAAWVLHRIGTELTVDPVPEWFTPGLAERGWTVYGAALAEGLMAYVAQIYTDHLEGGASWVLDRDPKSAYYLKPTIDAFGIPPPWRQVLGALGTMQQGGPPDRLRTTVEHSLCHHTRSPGHDDVASPPEAEPWVVLVSAGGGEWQVSFPEDIAERLGQAAYAELEDRLHAVEGVREAIMEDRDRAIIRTRRGVAQADLAARLEVAVASLAGST